MRPRILIVDDDSKFTEQLESHLRSNYDVAVESDFSASLNQAAQYNPHLILLDYKLEKKNGVLWLDQLRSLGHSIPVVVMSGYPDQKMAIEFMKRSVFSFVEKPFTLGELDEVVMRALSAKPVSDVSAGRPLALDMGTRCLIAGQDRIELTPTEYKILDLLIANANQSVERSEIIKKALGKESVSRNTLDTHISNLKKKVPELEARIKVVYGHGFLFDSNPT